MGCISLRNMLYWPWQEVGRVESARFRLHERLELIEAFDTSQTSGHSNLPVRRFAQALPYVSAFADVEGMEYLWRRNSNPRISLNY